ncbi:MAG: hypothetical protein U5K75_00745 [Ahrensia sp.]|nr:hypothetical protein [Ahrensia sp.]
MAKRSFRPIRWLVALLRRRPLLTSFFVIAATLTIVFAVKAAVHFNYLKDHRSRPIAAWMSPNYIARVWSLDQAEIYSVLGISEQANHNRPIALIAAQQSRSSGELIEIINSLIKTEAGDPPK